MKTCDKPIKCRNYQVKRVSGCTPWLTSCGRGTCTDVKRYTTFLLLDNFLFFLFLFFLLVFPFFLGFLLLRTNNWDGGLKLDVGWVGTFDITKLRINTNVCFKITQRIIPSVADSVGELKMKTPVLIALLSNGEVNVLIVMCFALARHCSFKKLCKISKHFLQTLHII